MANASIYPLKPPRPRSVTLIAAGVLLLGLVNIYRAAVLYQQIGLQLDLGVSVDPRVRFGLALIWSVVFVVLGCLLWWRRSWTRILVPTLLLLYAIYRLALVALFAGSEYARDSQLATIIFYGITIAFTAWALNRSSARAYFDRGKHARELEVDPSE